MNGCFGDARVDSFMTNRVNGGMRVLPSDCLSMTVRLFLIVGVLFVAKHVSTATKAHHQYDEGSPKQPTENIFHFSLPSHKYL